MSYKVEDSNGTIVLKSDELNGDPFFAGGNTMFLAFVTGSTVFREATLQFRARDEDGVYSVWTATSFSIVTGSRHRSTATAYGIEYRFAVTTIGTTVKMYNRATAVYTALSARPAA